MEVQSAFNAGIQGFQQAKENATQAASDIVASTTLNTEANQKSNTEVTSEVVTQKDAPELNQAVVDLKVAEYQAKSSAEVIKTADETLGTLLDVTA
ncbi:hypothetical protein [Colwellia sp. RSH04]|uniref:hypothetical protein n=1 Tax=Colwellia sp. RSH04 TaxID=2305464 RepID=UPI000E5986A5|nr:hypothetical protein [Colwellia sp. RSH04]RHW76378.1 hypothetical protein D1094_08655 [Colwellia sp. RSH04]